MITKKINCETHTNKYLKSFSKHPNNLKVCNRCLLIFKDKKFEENYKTVISFKKFNETSKYNVSNKKVDNDLIFLNKYSKILNIKEKIDVLDYGCGYGWFLEALQKKNINGYGYDINEFFYKNLIKKFDMFHKTKDIEDFNKKFDIIFVKKVLCLSPDIIKDFILFKKKLKVGGHLVILDQVAEFNRDAYHSLYFQKNSSHSHLLTMESLIKIAKAFNLVPVYKRNILGNIQLFLKNQNNEIAEINNEGNFFFYRIKIKTHLYLGFIFIFFHRIFQFLRDNFIK